MIKLRSEELEALRKYESSHISLIDELKKTPGILNISSNLDSFLQEPASEDEFEYGKAYIINAEKKKVGIIGTKDIDKEGILELWYIIRKHYRNKGYGSKTLGLITQYIMEYTNAKDIKLVIDKSNIHSIKCAEDNGYTVSSESNNKYVYKYFN